MSLLELIRPIAPYLLATSDNQALLALCDNGFRAVQLVGANAGWLRLLKADVYYAMGEWQRGFDEAALAMTHSVNDDPVTHARAMLTMGRLQLNTGDYSKALKTLATAQDLLTALDDREGAATALTEFASYYLNRGENQKALQLYQEADRIRGRIETANLTDHSLLMLGVVYRRLGEYDRALDYLTTLMTRGESRKMPTQVATAKHHIAWVYLQENRTAEARHYAESARQLYLQYQDPRGVSDADEQLGVICLREGHVSDAKRWLRQSISVRRQLHNRHGVASSLRRLALVFFREHNWIIALWCFGRSLWLYARMNMLSRERIHKFFLSIRQNFREPQA